MYKTICDLVNLGIFLCVLQIVAVCAVISNSFRKRNLFNKVLPFSYSFQGFSFGFLIGIDTFRIKCIL